MKEKKPKVSVIAPVYNVEAYLQQFIDSVIDQTFKEWELILVDDGSEDNSLSIAKTYAQTNDNIICIQNEHRNAGYARNTGLDAAVGDYVLFLDSDDYCRDNMIERMFEAAQDNDADIVLCQADYYSEKYGVTKPMTWVLNRDKMPSDGKECYNRETNSAYLFQSTIISPWNKLIKRKLLMENQIKAQDQIAANDVVLSCVSLACANRIFPLFESLYVQRRDNPNSITGNLSTEEKHMCGYSASLGLLKELERLGLYELLKDALFPAKYFP